MVGHVQDLTPRERRELLTLLTQERADLQTDEEVLAELSDTLRRQLGLRAGTDLAEGFRRRMIRVAEELGASHPPGYYDFRSDRVVAEDVLEQVARHVETLSKSADDDDFMLDFAKTFQTMSQDRRAAWLRGAAMAASTAKQGEVDPERAADAASQKSSAGKTAKSIASDVADLEVFDIVMASRAARGAVAVGAKRAAPTLGVRSVALAAAAAPLGLVAGGAVAFAIRKRRVAQQKARDAEAVQVRRERQATQAVVTTCSFVLAAIELA